MKSYNLPVIDPAWNTMIQRLRGITNSEATGPTRDLFEASNVMLGKY